MSPGSLQLAISAIRLPDLASRRCVLCCEHTLLRYVHILKGCSSALALGYRLTAPGRHGTQRAEAVLVNELSLRSSPCDAACVGRVPVLNF